MIGHAFFAVAMAIAFGQSCNAGFAQSYPSREVKIIVPFPRGGIIDANATILARYLTMHFKQPFTVDNRPGGGGVPGTAFVSTAEPDGYTLVFGTALTLGVAPALSTKVAYDPVRSFAPAGTFSESPIVFVTNPSVPGATCPEFIKYAQSSPGKYQFASTGLGSLSHINAELFKINAKLDIRNVPFRTDAESVISVLSGQVDMTFQGMGLVLPQISTTKLRPLGIASAKRNAKLPNVPTMNECGQPGFVSSSWTALLAPAKTPDSITNSLNVGINLALKEVSGQLSEIQYEPVGGPPQELQGRISAEKEKWTYVATVARLRLD